MEHNEQCGKMYKATNPHFTDHTPHVTDKMKAPFKAEMFFTYVTCAVHPMRIALMLYSHLTSLLFPFSAVQSINLDSVTHTGSCVGPGRREIGHS